MVDTMPAKEYIPARWWWWSLLITNRSIR